MMQRIDLAPMLRETLTTPYSDMVPDRPGVAFAKDRQPSRARVIALPISILPVGLLDFSCADDVVAKLLLRVFDEEEHFVVLSGITDSHLDAIDHVLERHGLSVAAPGDGDEAARVLGVTTPDVQTAFQAIQRLGAGDAKRLADALHWTVERAADALQSLALRRLIQAGGGTYRPLTLP